MSIVDFDSIEIQERDVVMSNRRRGSVGARSLESA